MEMLTFIIPCHNELDHTKTGITSILENSPRDRINFVFIDNGSTDGTYEFLKTIPHSHIIRNQHNVYVNPAWNQGFKYVLDNNLGDYVCLCNNDIKVGKNWLDPIFWLFKTHVSEFYLPMSNTQELPAFNSDEGFEKYIQDVWNEPLYLRQVKEPFIGFCFFFHKRHIKYFYPIPEQMKVLRGDDWLCDCLVHHGLSAQRVSRCVVHHFGGATQRGMPIDDLRSRDAEEFNKLYETEYKSRGMGRIYENKTIRITLL